jgi:PRTRC genetic system protein C
VTTIAQPERKFRFGTTTVDDPDPGMSPAEVKELYAANYPHLASATINEPVLEGQHLIYTFTPPEAKTKG